MPDTPETSPNPPAPAAPPPAPAKGLRIPWGLLLLLLVIGVSIYSTAIVGQRAAHLDALVATYQLERDNYAIAVCPEKPLLATVPTWAAPLRDQCREVTPTWGTEAPATEAVAAAALQPKERSGFATAIGRFIRTFNPIILLEIFVALTVAFFVLLGVRGGETPAETVISRLGGTLRTKWITTAKRAAIVGLILGAGSLVAGTWASELREEKKVCRETAVSYAHLLGIDQRCAVLRDELATAVETREQAIAARTRCEVSLAETSATMAANASIEQTASELGASMRAEQDEKTKVLLDAISTSFSGLAKQLAAARADATALRTEVAKEKSLAANRESLDALSKSVATRTAMEAAQRDLDALAAMAKGAAKEETLVASIASSKQRGETLDAKLAELRSRQCLVKSDLTPLEAAIKEATKARPMAATGP